MVPANYVCRYCLKMGGLGSSEQFSFDIRLCLVPMAKLRKGMDRTEQRSPFQLMEIKTLSTGIPAHLKAQ